MTIKRNIYVCVECQSQYEPVRAQQRFCTEKCRYKFHNRIKLGKLRFAEEKGYEK